MTAEAAPAAHDKRSRFADGLGHGHVRPRPDGVKARCGGVRLCKKCRAEESALAAEWTAAVAADEAERTALYRGRATLAAHIASMYPASLGYTDPETPDWPVLMILGPFGQMTWHIAPGDIELFHHVSTREDFPAWDGHTSEQAYGRLALATALRTTVHADAPATHRRDVTASAALSAVLADDDENAARAALASLPLADVFTIAAAAQRLARLAMVVAA